MIFTTSAAGGTSGATVTVAVLVTENHRAVIVTLVGVQTVEVASLNAPVDRLALTTVS